ncbi:hypothetical protein TRICI_001882 [Trichomonascus ciferrii]|uniref:Pre-rRNA-processing protein IPI3 n=1 Tax=Trichomonascus ciferrii TaxID=44093 RepID=A0A642VC62_9ASCO|nr:hypothetical protein TRICI_001882 [Trichomonascus ciferrii]
MEEIVIYGSDGGKTVTNTSHATDQFVTACDLHTGSHLWTYKKSSSPMHGLVANDQYIFANQVDQAQLFIYTHGRETFSQKLILPERVGCISVSPKGNYLAVGGDTGRLLIWGLRTGKLILAQDTHYQGITTLQFTQDDAYLFSGGNDARVFGWNMTEVVNLSLDKSTESVQPALTFTDHSLAVTDIVVGYGKCTETRVFTCSLDQTVRCWDLVTGQLLTTFVLSEKVHSIAVDPIERAIYAGLSNGIIQDIQLYNQNKATGAIETVGGARRIITIEPQESKSLAQHTSVVTCLKLSFDATLLVSGDDKGQVLIWELSSKQVTRRPKQHRGAISSIQLICRKKDLHPNKMVSNANTTNQLPILERTLTTSIPKKDDIWIQLKDSVKDQQPPSELDILQDVEIAKAQAAQFAGENTQSGLQAKVQQLETDLSQLYQHYTNLKSVHEDLWKLHVKK